MSSSSCSTSGRSRSGSSTSGETRPFPFCASDASVGTCQSTRSARSMWGAAHDPARTPSGRRVQPRCPRHRMPPSHVLRCTLGEATRVAGVRHRARGSHARRCCSVTGCWGSGSCGCRLSASCSRTGPDAPPLSSSASADADREGLRPPDEVDVDGAFVNPPTTGTAGRTAAPAGYALGWLAGFQGSPSSSDRSRRL
jgi:hypothetical protein